MLKRGSVLALLLILSLVMTSSAIGQDFFLFDLEKNKILFMGNNDTAFAEKMDLEKIPDLVMRTNDPNKYLVVYMPQPPEDKEEFQDEWRPVADGPESEEKKGRLMLINIETGRTDDVIDLGYAPFRTSLSRDRKQFLVSSRTAPSGDVCEILHYNIAEKKSERLTVGRVNNLDFSLDSKTGYALILDSEKNGRVLTLSLSPLKIKHSLTTGSYPFKVYALSNNRAVLLELGGRWRSREISGMKVSDTIEEHKGAVRLIDTEKNKVIETVTFNPAYIWFEWYREQNTMFLIINEAKHEWDSNNELVWSGTTRFVRINGNGMKHIQTKLAWDYHYLPTKDILYALTERNLEVYDYNRSPEKPQKVIKTGMNYYNEEFSQSGGNYITTLRYFVNVLNEANLITVYSNYNGIIKFYDPETGKLIQKVKGAKMRGMLPQDFGDKASVTTNQDKTRFYVLNRARKGLTIFDEKLKEIATVDLSNERPISMYQVKKPVFQTILATEKGLYKLEEKGTKLICQFEKKTKDIYLYQEDQRLIFFINDSWFIIDPVTLELKYKLDEFGDPNEKYTKVEKGQRRFYYIPSPYDWSE